MRPLGLVVAEDVCKGPIFLLSAVEEWGILVFSQLQGNEHH